MLIHFFSLLSVIYIFQQPLRFYSSLPLFIFLAFFGLLIFFHNYKFSLLSISNRYLTVLLLFALLMIVNFYVFMNNYGVKNLLRWVTVAVPLFLCINYIYFIKKMSYPSFCKSIFAISIIFLIANFSLFILYIFYISSIDTLISFKEAVLFSRKMDRIFLASKYGDNIYLSDFSRPSFGNPISAAWSNFLLLFINLILFVKKNSKQSRIFHFLFFSLSFFAILLSGTRSVLFCCLIFLFAFILINKSKFFSAVLCITALSLFLFIYFTLPNFNVDRVVPNVWSVISSGSGPERIALFQSAYYTFLNNPIFGNGFGSWILEYKKVAFTTQTTESAILQILCESGIFGIAITFLIFLVIFRKNFLINQSRSDKKNIFFFSSIFSFFVYTMTSSIDPADIFVFILFSFSIRSLLLKDNHGFS